MASNIRRKPSLVVSRPSYLNTTGHCGQTLMGSAPTSQSTNDTSMCLPMSGGERFQVPIDVEVGSRATDEKRKRNAGASARFRQRKKMREQAWAEEFRKLNQRIMQLHAALDSCKKDRDHLKSVLMQNQHTSPLILGPVSNTKCSDKAVDPFCSSIDAAQSLHGIHATRALNNRDVAVPESLTAGLRTSRPTSQLGALPPPSLHGPHTFHQPCGQDPASTEVGTKNELILPPLSITNVGWPQELPALSSIITTMTRVLPYDI